jgi:hypothetical protein
VRLVPDARVIALAAREDVGLAPVRAREQRLEALVELGQQWLGAAAGGGLQPVDLVQVPARVLPQLAGRVCRAGAARAELRLEAVGQLGLVEVPGRAQVREQIVGRAVATRAAQQREQGAAERRVGERDAAVDRERDAVGVEDLLDDRPVRGRVAEDDGDLAGLRAGAQKREYLGGDQLDLGALAARREQPHGVARIGRRAGDRLEQIALHVVQGGARLGDVELIRRLDLDVVVARQLRQPLEHRRERLERRAAALVRQRHGDLGVGLARE